MLKRQVSYTSGKQMAETPEEKEDKRDGATHDGCCHERAGWTSPSDWEADLLVLLPVLLLVRW